MKVKNFDNFLEKNSNLSKSFIDVLQYGNKLINEYVDLEAKIKKYKNLKDPDEEMEELLQDWLNHLVNHPPRKKNLSTQVLKQYLNAVNKYLKYHRFHTELKNLKFPKQLRDEKYALTEGEIKQILEVAKWEKKAYYLCLLSTGARPREILGLTKDDVVWVGDKYKAIIPARLSKRGHSRTVFFSKECTSFLNMLMKRDGDNIFPHHQDNIKSAMSNEAIVFASYCEKVGLSQKYNTTGYRKITLYSFRSFFITKALDLLKDDIVHALVGHSGYLQVYQRRTDEQKKEIWDEIESEILIFDQSKKEQKIRDLEVALNHTTQLEERINDQDKRINELSNSEKELVKAFKMIKSGFATLEDIEDNKVRVNLTDKAIEE